MGLTATVAAAAAAATIAAGTGMWRTVVSASTNPSFPPPPRVELWVKSLFSSSRISSAPPSMGEWGGWCSEEDEAAGGMEYWAGSGGGGHGAAGGTGGWGLSGGGGRLPPFLGHQAAAYGEWWGVS